MAGENVKTFTAENWSSDVLGSKEPVLVDFWAAWCGPCRMVAPVIEELANEYLGKVTVGKVNVDEQPAVSGQYKVMSIPTLAIFKNGELVEQSVGFRGKADLVKMLEKHA
ncbi:thioredoxin [Desulfitobacterium dichloroeliminans LMG P-21439]|uniref:Thioredoxin n=1 Tax=Desulfitobacterium dichloroeliminans (strain LMG P-21439 / DCA1) TaxID=871963 RepID=L0F7V4_DESDL|nr:thioredoxin [Desulfitobacterium dichloroeliminans]AGA69919.1 thioredoxin [Desulfitobacterium dichloroeliminans LMG P-21439]